MSSAGIGAPLVSGEKAGVGRGSDGRTGDLLATPVGVGCAPSAGRVRLFGQRTDGGEQPEVGPLAAM
jgi:hypothetical protein